MTNFPGKGKVAVLKTSPATVLDDIERLMVLAGVKDALPVGVTTGLKINISWQIWYPFVGRPRVAAALQTPWGKLFKSYGDGQVVMPGMEPKTVVQAALGLGALAAVLGLGAWWLRGRPR